MWTEEEKQKVLFGPGGAEGAEGAVPAGAVPRAAHRERAFSLQQETGWEFHQIWESPSQIHEGNSKLGWVFLA